MHCILIHTSSRARNLALRAKLAKVTSLDNEHERLTGAEVSSSRLDIYIQIDGFVR